MARLALPRICIALGFPDAETLLAHARKEYDAGERFFEFRLDYFPDPEHGIAAIRKFLSRHSDCADSAAGRLKAGAKIRHGSSADPAATSAARPQAVLVLSRYS